MSNLTRINSIIVCIAYLILTHGNVSSQTLVAINDIIISGNQRTNQDVILRELDFSIGDTIRLEDLSTLLALSEKRLLSTGLFTWADVNISHWTSDTLQRVDLSIKVQENWYLYPYLIFELADRNFNIWKEEHNYSLKRTNYGVALTHINFTGHKDVLKLKWQSGFTKKYELYYDYPYLKGNHGMFVNILYTTNKEWGLFAHDNILRFHKVEDNKTLLSQLKIAFGIQKRPNAYSFHILRAEYVNAQMDEDVNKSLFPQFFFPETPQLKYGLLHYEWMYDKTVYPLYPLGGYRLFLTLRKEGLGFQSDINNLRISLDIEKTKLLTKHLILSSRIKLKTTLFNKTLPYYLNQAIGYGTDNISGYQLYVLDGTDFILNTNSLKIPLLMKTYQWPHWWLKNFRKMDTKIFLRPSFDIAYTNDPTHFTANPYSNRWIYGYGMSLDIILFNIYSLSIQYGITQFGQKGIYLNSGVTF